MPYCVSNQQRNHLLQFVKVFMGLVHGWFVCGFEGCPHLRMFPKNRGGPPKSSILIGCFHYVHHPFSGFSPYFWKHPFFSENSPPHLIPTKKKKNTGSYGIAQMMDGDRDAQLERWWMRRCQSPNGSQRWGNGLHNSQTLLEIWRWNLSSIKKKQFEYISIKGCDFTKHLITWKKTKLVFFWYLQALPSMIHISYINHVRTRHWFFKLICSTVILLRHGYWIHVFPTHRGNEMMAPTHSYLLMVRLTLPETNSSHLKNDGWKTILSFWDGLFSGAKMLVSGSVWLMNLMAILGIPKPHESYLIIAADLWNDPSDPSNLLVDRNSLLHQVYYSILYNFMLQ